MIILEIKLTEPKLKGIRSLEECILERQSVRSFKDRDIEIEKISQILWAGQGKKVFLLSVLYKTKQRKECMQQQKRKRGFAGC